jgi:hypothetical protein
MYQARARRIMWCMSDDRRMPGQFLPTWAITLLVVVFGTIGCVAALVALVGG